MDDLAAMLQNILNDPEQRKTIQSFFGENAVDLSGLEELLSSGTAEQSDQHTEAAGGPDVGTILQMQKLLSSLSGESDKNIELLQALKQHFGEARRHKADDAIKMLRLFKVLPLLQASGLFGGEHR